MGRPGDGLHRSLVVIELRQRLRRASGAPKHKLVVIATGSKLLIVEGPLEAADLLAMAQQLCCIIVWASKVSVQDAVVPAARAHESVVPGDGTDAPVVTSECL